MSFSLDLSNIKQGFTKLPSGVYTAIVKECKEVEKDFFKNPPFYGSGKGIELVYETRGNKDKAHNNKTIYHNMPLDGDLANICQATMSVILPDNNSFTDADMEAVKGKMIEIIIEYKMDQSTRQERKYPNVKKVCPYIAEGAAGDVDVFDKF